MSLMELLLFHIVPQEKYEQVLDQVFQELEYEECSEDTCIMRVQELLQVENVFNLQIIGESNDTQLNLKWITLDEKRNETNYCEGCNTKKLNDKVRSLVEKFVSNQEIEEPNVLVQKKARETIPKTKSFGVSVYKKMSVRFDSSLIGVYNEELRDFNNYNLKLDNAEKSLDLSKIGVFFKNKFGAGLSIINWVNTTKYNNNWGVSGTFLDVFYVLLDDNRYNYLRGSTPLSWTIGTSYPLSLEMNYGTSNKDNEPGFISLLNSVGYIISDDFELLLNGAYYNFDSEGYINFSLFTYTLGIGYFF